MFYNTFKYYDVFSIALSFLTAGFAAVGHRNSRNIGWLFIIVASFSPVLRGGYNLPENAIMINSFPKPQPFFTYWDYFSKALFIIGIALLALRYTEPERKDTSRGGAIGDLQSLTLGWVLPSVLLVLTLAFIQTILGHFYIFAIIQTIGFALLLLYISLCLILARTYTTKSNLLRFSLRLHFIMLAAGVVMGILRRSI